MIYGNFTNQPVHFRFESKFTHLVLLQGCCSLEDQEVWQSRARGMSQFRKLTLNSIELAGHAVKLLNQNAMKTILHRHLQH